MKSILTIEGMTSAELSSLVSSGLAFKEQLAAGAPDRILQGDVVATLFFEPSTRTRLSFELAARHLGAEVITFWPGSSSMAKGETEVDTAHVVASMGATTLIVRHATPGVPTHIAARVPVAVVNAGDGAHQHPTQALADCLALQQRFGGISGLRINFVGDIAHSRVFRSCARAFELLGAKVTLVAPSTLLPPAAAEWGYAISSDLDGVIGDCDVVYLLRVQRERGGGGRFPSESELHRRFGLTAERRERLSPDTAIMHAGPFNRGVELDQEAPEDPRSLIWEQVACGVPVRMAVLAAVGQ